MAKYPDDYMPFPQDETRHETNDFLDQRRSGLVTKQAEKALRGAGWEQVTRSDVEPGEEYYDLQAGWVTKAGHALDGVPMPNYLVLRAPRPEPEYELGTVARVRSDEGKEFNALMDEYGFWLTVDGSYQSGSVEVLRVVAYPDGSGPWIKPMGNQVDQIKVIDESGYGYVNTSARDVEYAFEDDGKTLEVFTGGTGSTHRPGDSFGKYVTDIDAASGRMDARGRELLEQFWAQFDGKDDTK